MYKHNDLVSQNGAISFIISKDIRIICKITPYWFNHGKEECIEHEWKIVMK